MRAFYELCSKAEVCANTDPVAALGLLIEAYALIRPEVLKAQARFEPKTATGFLETLRATAERCGRTGLGLERTAWAEPTTSFSRAPRTDGNTSTLRRWRWSKHREHTGGTIEHWFDVACRCPSF